MFNNVYRPYKACVNTEAIEYMIELSGLSIGHAVQCTDSWFHAEHDQIVVPVIYEHKIYTPSEEYFHEEKVPAMIDTSLSDFLSFGLKEETCKERDNIHETELIAFASDTDLWFYTTEGNYLKTGNWFFSEAAEIKPVLFFYNNFWYIADSIYSFYAKEIKQILEISFQNSKTEIQSCISNIL